MSAKQETSSYLRWLLCVLQKEIYMHERDIKLVNGNLLYLRDECLAAGNNAAGKERKYIQKTASAKSPEAQELLRTKYLASKTGTDRLNLKWATAYRLEREKVFPMTNKLDAMREEEATLQARLANCVKTLKGTNRVHDDIDRETNKMTMDKWFAEEDSAFASLISGLRGADRLRQLMHLRDGTLDKFHDERTTQIKQAEEKIKQAEEKIRKQRAFRQQQFHREAIIRERHASHFQARLHQQQIEAERADAAMLHHYGAVSPHTILHSLPGTYGPGW